LVGGRASAGCGGGGLSQENPRPGDDDGGALPGLTNPPGTPPCAGYVTQTPPDAVICTGDPALCLSGTAAAAGFEVEAGTAPAHLCASLYDVFPEGTAQPLHSQLVALDGTWAFSGLDPWPHYFVAVVADFRLPGSGGGSVIQRTVGPLQVPRAGGAIDVRVPLAEVSLLQTVTSASAPSVDWASARVFDPSTGAALADAGVSIAIGATSVPMPWVATSKPGAYFVTFAPQTPAQSSYTITASDPALGGGVRTWGLVPDPPAFAAAITAPADGTSVPTTAPVTVEWQAQSSADFEFLSLFQQGDGGAWLPLYSSPGPLRPDVSQALLPTLGAGGRQLDPGAYLVDVSYAKANCPSSADGCVLARSVASARFTAR
jgi:hypothetical protein